MSLSLSLRASIRGQLAYQARQNRDNRLNYIPCNRETRNQSAEENLSDSQSSTSEILSNSSDQLLLEDMPNFENDNNLLLDMNQQRFVENVLTLISFKEKQKINLSIRGNEKLFEHSDKKLSEFIEELSYIICNNALTDHAGVEITELINEILPQESRIKFDYTSNGTKKPKLSHLSDDIFWYDCCPCFKTVYVNEFENLSECPECNERRYRTDSSIHRAPKQLISYRSIVLIIKELITTKNFLRAIKYTQLDANFKNVYGDVRNGRVYQRQLREMQNNFQSKYGNSHAVIEVNLLLTCYYDGAQLFSSRFSVFWPLLISILNLPPNLRKLFGAGIFVISALTTKAHSGHEDFILKERFICELLSLKDGIELSIGNQTYFIQARLVLHCYDTKAIEHILHVQATNSLSLCPLCNLVHG